MVHFYGGSHIISYELFLPFAVSRLMHRLAQNCLLRGSPGESFFQLCKLGICGIVKGQSNVYFYIAVGCK